jgi:hypothetical protein
VLKQAGVVLGQTYPERIIEDLRKARAVSVANMLDMKRQTLQHIDNGGYDIIVLPDGTTTRVFTKQEYRLDKSGQLLPPPLKREPRPSSPSHPSSPSSPRQTTLDSFLDLSPEKAVKRERGKAKGRTGRLQGAFGGSKPRAQ